MKREDNIYNKEVQERISKMPTLGEVIENKENANIEAVSSGITSTDVMVDPELEVMQQQLNESADIAPQRNLFTDLLKLIKTPSVNKSISEYTDHPLNIKNNDTWGYGVRCVEGFLGALDFAIVDGLRFYFGLKQDAMKGQSHE